MIRTTFSPYLLASACAITIAATPVRAHAEPTAEDKTTAQALFDFGQKLNAEGKYAESCPKFAESQRLDPAIGTEFYLADCLEHTGKLASAWTHYMEVASAARAAGETSRATFSRSKAEALKPRLSSLVVTVTEAAQHAEGLVVKRDGGAIAVAQWGVPIPLDQGSHKISASATGKKAWETSIDVKREGATMTVAIPVLDDEQVIKATPVAPTPPGPALPVSALAPPVPPDQPRGATQRKIGIAIGAVGLVGLGVGGTFGGVAISKNAASRDGDHCDSQSFCDATGKALRLDSFHAATASTVGFVAGSVLLAGGIVLFATAPARAASASVAVGPGSVAVVGRW